MSEIYESNKKQVLKVLVKSLYDLQEVRIQTGNRIVGNFRAKLGQAQGHELTDKEANKILTDLKKEYRRLTDGVVRLNKETIAKLTKQSGIISDPVEFNLVSLYFTVLKNEETAINNTADLLDEFPIWNAFLKNVKGVGPQIGAILIAYLDPYKARHASSFWAYAGVDVVILPDGSTEGRGKKEGHLVKREYVNKKGETKEKNSITYEPFLKTKLLGVLGPIFLKTRRYEDATKTTVIPGSDSPYAITYRNYRHRLDNHPAHKDKSDLQKYKMSMRYAIKMFLVDLWVAWRTLENLPVSKPYAVDKLGMPQHGE